MTGSHKCYPRPVNAPRPGDAPGLGILATSAAPVPAAVDLPDRAAQQFLVAVDHGVPDSQVHVALRDHLNIFVCRIRLNFLRADRDCGLRGVAAGIRAHRSRLRDTYANTPRRRSSPTSFDAIGDRNSSPRKMDPWNIWSRFSTMLECHESDGKSAAKNGTKRGTRRHCA